MRSSPGLTVLSRGDPPLSAALAKFQGGGPLEMRSSPGLAQHWRLRMSLSEPEPEPAALGGVMALAAPPEDNTPIASLAGLLGQKRRGGPSSICSRLRKPARADQSDPTIEAQDVLTNAPETLCFRAVHGRGDPARRRGDRGRGDHGRGDPADAVVTAGERFTAVVTRGGGGTQPDAVVTKDVVTQPDAVVTKDVITKADVVTKDVVTKDVITKDVVTKDEGTEGTDSKTGLVRKGPKYSPDTTILPVGSRSGDGAGGAWNPLQGVPKTPFIDSLVAVMLRMAPANATDSGAPRLTATTTAKPLRPL